MTAKYNLVERVQAKLGSNRTDAEAAVNAVIDAIAETLRDGDNVSLSNFGTFRVVHLDERLVRNPRNGELTLRPAEATVRFKQSPSLKPFVNFDQTRASISRKLPKGFAK
jgi:nucleoid DNA-binding protein